MKSWPSTKIMLCHVSLFGWQQLGLPMAGSMDCQWIGRRGFDRQLLKAFL